MFEHNPIDILTSEHDVISSAEDFIHSNENLWTGDAAGYENAVRNLLEFFRQYSDKFHHHKEEEVLFPEMSAHPEFMLQEIISELEEHHDLFREYVAKIDKAFNEGQWEKVQILLKQYMNDLLDHIAVENDELFVIAEGLFTEGESERMYFRFMDIDAELGLERKQELAGYVKILP